MECFNCGKKSHFARKCLEPRAECERCKRTGHLTAKCPQREKVNIVNNVESVSNLFERTLTVNRYKMKGLIDTGSGCTLIRNSVAEKYDMAILPRPSVTLQEFAGQTVTSERSTDCIVRDATIMNAEARVSAVIVPDAYLI